MLPMLFGPPGAGKGTQAELLSRQTGLPHISGGDLVREAAARGGEIGSKIDAVIRSGGIFDGPLALQLIVKRLQLPDCALGAILDGCARTVGQASMLDRMLSDLGRPITAVIALNVADRVARRRLLSRVVGRPVHGTADRAAVAGLEATPRHKLETVYRRPDDEPSVIEKRQFVYHQSTAPALEYYRHRGLVRDIDGERPADEVHLSILDALRLAEAF
jgi:adenylate kinase